MGTSCVTAATAAATSVTNRYNLVVFVEFIGTIVVLECTLDGYCLSNCQILFSGEVSTVFAFTAVNLQLGCCTVIV